MLEVDIVHRLGSFALDVHFRSHRQREEILGPRLKAGQSTKMVVNLPYKGQVYYSCREPEHGEMGESGYLTVR